jgi:hypothetical protein
MAYASTIDVVGHLPFIVGGTFTATSKPNATQVHDHLLTAAREIDAALSGRDYTVPVPETASAAFALLNGYNAIGAAMYSAQSMPAGKDGKHSTFLERRWTAILKGLREGDITLPDAGKETSRSRPRYGGSATPIFNRAFDGYGV